MFSTVRTLFFRREAFCAVVLALAGALPTGCHRSSPSDPLAADRAALTQVVETFRTAIIRRDKPAFMALFFSDQPERITGSPSWMIRASA